MDVIETLLRADIDVAQCGGPVEVLVVIVDKGPPLSLAEPSELAAVLILEVVGIDAAPENAALLAELSQLKEPN